MASTIVSPSYPSDATARDRWILSRRGARAAVDAQRPYAFLLEQERFANGEIGEVATVFLTNRECPWRCAMCDLWQHTLIESVPPGAIPGQIRYALDRLAPARQIKLYNSGSFFDARAIPVDDDEAIAVEVERFERVIVESHPSLVGERCLRLAARLRGKLEVAMGLETAHPAVLEKLNKRMTLDQYQRSAELLRANGIALRTFILVQPPFLRADESLFWACRSIDFALACGASAITLIPTRASNGAVEALAELGQFSPPRLEVVEDALDYGVALGQGRVFVDLWDAERFLCCSCCRAARVERLGRINLRQQCEPRIHCANTGSGG